LKTDEAWRKRNPTTINSIFSRSYSMSELTSYGLMAERHWREHRPKMVLELEGEGRLQPALLEAQERTAAEMDRLIRDFRRQNLTAQQAHDQRGNWCGRNTFCFKPETPE